MLARLGSGELMTSWKTVDWNFGLDVFAVTRRVLANLKNFTRAGTAMRNCESGRSEWHRGREERRFQTLAGWLNPKQLAATQGRNAEGCTEKMGRVRTPADEGER